MSKKTNNKKKKSSKKKPLKKSRVKKVATKKQNIVTSTNATQFKIYCIKEGITQVKIRQDTKLSIGCIHATWNEGKATDSTIKLISLVYGIDELKLKQMITSFEILNSKPVVKIGKKEITNDNSAEKA